VIVVSLRQLRQQGGNNFDDLALARGNRFRILLQRLRRLPLKITFGIILIGRTQAIGQEGIPPATSICIINDVPDRGRPNTTVITERRSSELECAPGSVLLDVPELSS
jgi:hypothetical protein